MAKRYSVLLFISMLVVACLRGQDLVQMRSALAGLDDKAQVEMYLKIGDVLADKYGKPDSLLFYSENALKKAEQIKYSDGILNARLHIAVAYQKKNQFDTSIVLLEALLSEAVIDSAFAGRIHYNLGLNYFRSGKNKEAIASFIHSVQLFEQTNQKEYLAMGYGRLGGVLANEQQPRESMEYGEKAKALLPEITEPYYKITVLSGLAGLYIQSNAADSSYLDSAIVYAKKTLELAIEFGYFTKVNQLASNLADAYMLQGDFINALEYCKQSIAYRSYLFPGEVMISYLKFSDCYFGLKKYDLSIAYLDSARPVVLELHDPYYEMAFYDRVYSYNKEAGNYQAALAGFEEYKRAQDSLFSLEKSQSINELVQKYNKSENEKKIVELNTQNEISGLRIRFLVIGVIAALLIIIMIIFFYRQSVLKNNYRILETEQRLNRARMNPHFFFNSMASLQALSMDDKRKEEVGQYIHRFSKIMRETLESSFAELDTVESEVEFLTHYLELQRMRSENKFSFAISVDEKIESSELMIPGMIIQPFVENAIEHGFATIENGGFVEVKFSEQNNELVVEIVDNGAAESKNELHPAYPSRATQIIKDRLFLLNKKYKTSAIFEVSNRADSKGTRVEIRLPLINKT